MPPIAEFAAAKVNLTLEVLGRRADGYHELRSLVAFALDAGDRLAFTSGEPFRLMTVGSEAGAIDGPNLIARVAEAMAASRPGLQLGAFELEKNLPVAAGVGGGSADAAAAIRALARANAIADPAAEFSGLALAIGADIPVCLGGEGRTAALMAGIGDTVARPATSTLLPPGGLAAILVNPRVPVPTGKVFTALAASALGDEEPAEPVHTDEEMSLISRDCRAYIAASRNDLEVPAIALAPAIADVLAALRGLPGCTLARMSGSGATCFGLFDDMLQAERAASELRCAQPQWWTAATRLG